MNIFKTYKISWWQVGLLKLCVLAFGVTIGANWADFFSQYIVLLVVIFFIIAIYLCYALLRK